MGITLRRLARGAMALLVVASLAWSPSCVAPGYPSVPDEATYVGELIGTDDVVAITVAGTDVVVYVCGGPETFRERSRWFRGELPSDGSTDVEVTAADGTTGVVQLVDGAATGRLGSENLELSARVTQPGTIAGLYAIVDAGCRTGVVVRQDPGAPPTVQGTWCNDLGIFAQVTPILPVELVEGGLRVAIDPGIQAPKKQLLVLPVDARDLD